MKRFDLLGPLPTERSTTVLEASAGTGKTFALAGLVTRYVAEGVATLDQMLLITFGRAASQELRDRVRGQIVDALRAFADPSTACTDLTQYLISAEWETRQRRLRDALAGFDAATIATTHQFCHIVLKSLGVAGDSDSGVTLVENLDELVCEIVNDRYLTHFGKERDTPPLSYPAALRLAREVVRNPATQLRPLQPEADSYALAALSFARDVLEQLEIRKRRRGILGFDDLLTRLAEALDAPDSPARVRMHQQWPIVMVDEFQDTDPVQWQVLERAFSGRSTLVLIGDPKQAIYAFRGGDIETYLRAAATAGDKQTLGTNWRSDAALVDRLQVVLRGAQLGGPDIVVHDVQAHHQGHRLAGAPHNDPFRLRVVSRNRDGIKVIPIADLRRSIGRDLAADIGALLSSGATFGGRPVRARDIAVIVEAHKDARACHTALTEAGIPAVYTGDTDVFSSDAAQDWLYLLEAFDQPHRPGLVRAAAATVFFGETAESLAVGGESLTDEIAGTLRTWAARARERGVAAVFEAAQLAGMGKRVLSWRGGERMMTDLAHLTELLQETAHRNGFGPAALRDWLRTQRSEGGAEAERNRRLDSDAAAVQIMTVWVSKGLQFPIVYLPFSFNRYVPEREYVLYHEDGLRCLHIGGRDDPDYSMADVAGRTEAARDASRLAYVALTRAQSQVVAWWAPSFDEPNGGLSRLLRGRAPGNPSVPDKCSPAKISDADALKRLRAWEAQGGPVIEDALVAGFVPAATSSPSDDLAVRVFDRPIDTAWRRTSYSGLLRAAEESGVSSEPEAAELDDEVDDIPLRSIPAGAHVPSPMAQLPAGAAFGSLVHAVLETTDPLAPSLVAELQTQIIRHAERWPVEVPAAELAAALEPMHDTPLGPLLPGVTLRQIGLRDRLCELDFEFPLAGGDAAGGSFARLADVGVLLSEHLAADDPLAVYASRLTGAGLGAQSLRGYLSGSVDAVLRVGSRYVVVDYKTNWLGTGEAPLTAADYSRPRMVEAMLHSDYPLQALLYSVVLHRFLSWRLPGYLPEEHLGGAVYLFVRGMCGAATPVVEGHPAGVFSWQPPSAFVVALSELLS
ncbi:exodeoxyribonuclease V subunit beta [Mycobacteroides abscessus]|uniref:exodeoxyribonuclease V subunit beta n=1 Tax=Mycobacteroides abscessus TaxID=36809 RepID=UPI0009287CD2|nr:exodeoxyribonuclease V subunit beta [Mycobacteroides abscessus]SHU05084.1 exodeoxyribonuclease V, beta subunit [Mycobacteroides abscessus subsp. bolletii]SHW72281.1 exodeoxyribonuclease V, beta subunit [Mycobacteroides abscessus subsp. bolletii]SHX32345.1 exodeoxyribonuclease V, beta subunit [Mycobacteroides abscessus subsp. bolletii]SHX64443.1 exodeoxyribonuclease V, beta subunit [Mycobacteroides abscessus subsp. bolletii]SKR98166.1 exodeoxyribonuclease V, beta subunit [Mycobacteroides abs